MVRHTWSGSDLDDLDNMEHALASTMKDSRRLQLTLFVPDAAASVLEPIRRRVDPVQHWLIPAHVTLCRDDELAHFSVEELGVQLALLDRPPLTLQFGAPEVFAGHGVLLPCIAGEESFHRLRVALLRSEAIRTDSAHITLAHPRNPLAPENIASTYASLSTPIIMTFTRVCLIEQVDGQPWQVQYECARLPRGAD